MYPYTSTITQDQITVDFEERFKVLIKYLNGFTKLNNFSIKFGKLGSRKTLEFVVEGRLGGDIFFGPIVMWRDFSSLLVIHPSPFLAADAPSMDAPSIREIYHISEYWDQICYRTKRHVAKVLNLTTLSEFIIPQRGYRGDTGPR